MYFIVKREGPCMGHTTHTGSNPVKVFMLFPHLGGKTRSFDIAELLIPKKRKEKPLQNLDCLGLVHNF